MYRCQRFSFGAEILDFDGERSTRDRLEFGAWQLIILGVQVVGASGTGRTTFVNTLVDEKGWLKHEDSSDPAAAAGSYFVQH